MADLIGCVLPAFDTPTADHTYVRTGDGRHAWACFGRKTAGRDLVAGVGSEKVADCIARPDEKAGIAYLRTGVCHQAANRILYPAGVTVDRARGYAVSHILYGAFGKDAIAWMARELPRCSSGGGGSLYSGRPRGDGPDGGSDEWMSMIHSYYQERISRADGNHLHADFGFAIDHLGFEFAVFLAARLGAAIDGETHRSLLSLQREAISTLDDFERRNDFNESTHVKFVNGVANDMSRHMADILGRARYQALTGSPPETRFNLVAPITAGAGVE